MTASRTGRPRRLSAGTRATGLVGLGTLVMAVSGYLFNTVCIRFLGPQRYGDVATLLAISALVAIPLAGLQSLIAREVAYASVAAHGTKVATFLRASVRLTAIVAGIVTAAGLALSPALASALSVASVTAVRLTVLSLFFGAVTAVLLGFMQGTGRFGQLSLSLTAYGVFRPTLLIPALYLGAGVAGAMGTSALASLAAVLIAAAFIRPLWFGERGEMGRLAGRDVTMIVGGSLAFASLTNSDVVLAAAFLDDHTTGVYAAAALVGKSLLILPLAVTTVLLPRSARDAAAGASSEWMVLRSVAVTSVLTVGCTVILAVTPRSVASAAFGAEFASAADLFGLFGLAMSLAAVVNVYLYVYLGRGAPRFPAVVGVAAVVQIVGIVYFHQTPRQIILVTIACFGALLAVHEALFPYSVVRLLRWRRRQAGGIVEPGIGRVDGS